MTSLEEYRFCLNSIRKIKNEFNIFDVICLLEIYFDHIVFYPSISDDLNFYAKELSIENATKNFELDFNIYTIHYSCWRFIKQ